MARRSLLVAIAAIATALAPAEPRMRRRPRVTSLRRRPPVALPVVDVTWTARPTSAQRSGARRAPAGPSRSPGPGRDAHSAAGGGPLDRTDLRGEGTCCYYVQDDDLVPATPASSSGSPSTRAAAGTTPPTPSRRASTSPARPTSPPYGRGHAQQHATPARAPPRTPAASASAPAPVDPGRRQALGHEPVRRRRLPDLQRRTMPDNAGHLALPSRSSSTTPTRAARSCAGRGRGRQRHASP